PAALLLLPPPPSGTHTLSLHDALPIWVVEQCEQQMLDGHVLMALLAGALVALADAELQVLAEHWKASESCCGPRWGCPHAFPCHPSTVEGSRCGRFRFHLSNERCGACRPPGHAFSIVHNKGCWFSRENSLTCATFDSATSRVKTPHTPLPRVCTWSMIWVA